MGRIPVRLSRDDLDPHDPGHAVRVPLQSGNPDRIAGQVLAGEDPHAGRRLLQRPLEDPEPRLGLAAVRQRHRAAEIDWPDPGNAAGAKFLDSRGRVGRGQRRPFDPFAAPRKERAARGVVRRLGQDPDELDVIGPEHDGVVAGPHVGAVGPARRKGEAETAPGLGGAVEVTHQDDDVVEPDDMLQRHVFFLLAS
jgi:hypothetical protein